MTRHVRVVGVVVLLVGSLLGAAAVGGAQSNVAETNATTAYNGLEGGGQAVAVEFTLTAQTQITGLRIDVAPTQRSFVDYGSVQPAASGEGVSISSPSQGVYQVDQLEQGQSVTLTFDAYPRQLDQERLAVSVISLSAENPNTYEDSVTVRADLSSSPLLAYQEAQSELENTETLGTATIGGIVVAVLVGLVGLAVGGYYRFRAIPAAKDAKDEAFVEDLADLKGRVPSNQAVQEIDDLQSEYDEADILEDI